MKESNRTAAAPGTFSPTRTNLVLAAILLVYVALALAYSFATPPWEAPDEPAHYLYAEYLVLHASLPPPTPPQRGHFWQHGYITSLYEWHQPPLYYALLALPLSIVERLRPEALSQPFPAVNPNLPGAINLFVPVEDAGFAAQPALRTARLVSTLLGAIGVWLLYRLTRRVTGDAVTALTAAGFMAFIPQFTFLSGYVTNDALVIPVAALFLLAAVNLLDGTGRAGMRWVILAGLTASLALLTKLSLIYVLPLGVLSLLWRWRQHRSLRRWLAESLAFGLAALLPLAGGMLWLPMMRRQWAYVLTLKPAPRYMNLSYVLHLWPMTIHSLWATFGWMGVPAPAWIPLTLSLVSLIGLAGSLVLLLRGGRPSTPWLRASLALSWIVIGLVVLGFIRYNLVVRQPQGRLLFSALPAFVLLVAAGLSRLAGRYRAVAGGGLVILTLSLNLISLFGVLLPAYA